MKVLNIIPVTDATLLSSNVPETDWPQWNNATNYAADARVISLTNHGIYQSRIDGNAGRDPANPANIFHPETNPTGAWIYVSKTNRWRAFDGRNSAKVRQADEIQYELQIAATTDTVAIIGLEARSVRVEIEAPVELPPVYGPELIVNNTFDTDYSGWTPHRSPALLSVGNGRVHITSGPLGLSGIVQRFKTVPGKTYEIRASILSGDPGTARGRINLVTDFVTYAGGEAVASTQASQMPVNVVHYFTATQTEYALRVYSSLQNERVTFDDISVRELIYPARTVVFDETRQLLDTSGVRTWFDYFTFETSEFVEHVVLENLTAFAGYTLRLTVENLGGIAGFSILGYGRSRQIGKTRFGTEPGLRDFSTNEFDVFGNRILVPRNYARNITWQLAIDRFDYPRIERILAPLRAVPAIYYESAALPHNLIVLGTYERLSTPIDVGFCACTLTVEGNT